MKIDHIAVAVRNIEDAMEKWSLFLKSEPSIKVMESEEVKLFVVKIGETKIEIIAPLHENSNLNNFLNKRGEGLHHICLAVENFDEFKERLKNSKIQIVKEGTGYDGKRVVFCHPSSFNSVLLEVKECE